MKIDYPGLIKQTLPSGTEIYRVRPQGQHSKRIQITGEFGSDEFIRQYWIARRGEKPEPAKKSSEQEAPRSIGWLVQSYIEYLEERMKAGTTSPKTLKKKRNLLKILTVEPDKKMLVPREKLIEKQDQMGATPAQADAFIKAVNVMYEWAIERNYIKENTAKGIKPIYRKGNGATPWKGEDVKKFFKKHKQGSKAYIAMNILLWTGCRIEDLTILGRKYECVIDGIEALRWTPPKRGSTEVSLPLFAPLKAATRSATVQGNTYVLGKGGNPYASGDAMSATFKSWCRQAGLPKLSAHGVRKGLAELLAEFGCTQYEIMAILGHSEAKTSEVYTRRVERWKLAQGAMGRVSENVTWF